MQVTSGSSRRPSRWRRRRRRRRGPSSRRPPASSILGQVCLRPRSSSSNALQQTDSALKSWSTAVQSSFEIHQCSVCAVCVWKELDPAGRSGIFSNPEMRRSLGSEDTHLNTFVHVASRQNKNWNMVGNIVNICLK